MRSVPRVTQVFAPRDRAYFDLFEEAGHNVLQSAELLERLLSDFPDNRNLAQDIRDCEHEGDRVTHEILDRLNHTQVTPIDREARCRHCELLEGCQAHPLAGQPRVHAADLKQSWRIERRLATESSCTSALWAD